MHYVEFCTSAGPGTLIEHGVTEVAVPTGGLSVAQVEAPELVGGWMIFLRGDITPELYSEFIAIHGGEKAI